MNRDGRPSSRARGYSWRWERYIRPSYLQRYPLCARCRSRGVITAATQVHHKVELAHGGDHSDANLESLCASCHSRHTSRSLPFGRNKNPTPVYGCDEHGVPLDANHRWRRGD